MSLINPNSVCVCCFLFCMLLGFFVLFIDNCFLILMDNTEAGESVSGFEMGIKILKTAFRCS